MVRLNLVYSNYTVEDIPNFNSTMVRLNRGTRSPETLTIPNFNSTMVRLNQAGDTMTGGLTVKFQFHYG